MELRDKIINKAMKEKPYLIWGQDKDFVDIIIKEAQKELLEKIRVYLKNNYNRCIASEIDNKFSSN